MHPLKTSTEHLLKFLIFLHPCTLGILRSKERLPTLFGLLISPKLLPCVCVVVSQIKAKVNGKKYDLKHYIYFQELGSIMSLALFLYSRNIFVLFVDFRWTLHKTTKFGLFSVILSPCRKANNNFGGIQKNEKSSLWSFKVCKR